MNSIYSLPANPGITIETHYQGRKINKWFYKTNPHLFTDFPCAKDVDTVRQQILKNKIKDVFYTIVVFENGIYTLET